MSTDNLCHILRTHRDAVAALEMEKVTPTTPTPLRSDANTVLTFDEFCMLTSYLTVLQQEIHENGCVSPIKGTNLPQPPIYLTNQLDFTHSQQQQQQQVSRTSLHGLYSSQIFRTSSCKSVPEDQRRNGTADLYEQQQRHLRSGAKSTDEGVMQPQTSIETMDSDPMESVFPSASSAASNSDADAVVLRKRSTDDGCTTASAVAGRLTRDVYLGGSCALRTKWRTELAVPLLEQRSITYHLPATQEQAQSVTSSRINGDSGVVNAIVGEQQIYDPAVMDACHVLLFVVTNETRSLAPMTLAAHYIGLGYNVVLCVQMLPEFCIIGSERVSLMPLFVG